MIILYFVLLIKLKENPVFIQKRLGFKCSVFNLYKFKTMKTIHDIDLNLLSDEERMTNFGSFIRGISLDELPQLFNIVKNEMSIVGPRPLLVDYLPLYSEMQNKRHDVKPGITGWAQVNGRNAISWDEKFSFDIWYVNNQSFRLDLKIIYLTLLKVLRRSDISSSTSVTMEKFKGNR